MNLTGEFLVLSAIVVIAFDVWTMVKRGADTTVSWTLYSVAQKYPVVPFAIGMLMGHLFWVQHGA